MFLGIDLGTSSLKALVLDVDGAIVGRAAASYSMSAPQPGWSESDPQDWWQALGSSVKGALVKADVRASEVGAICIDTTCCSVVALDREGRPLRPAMIWMDVRSANQADAVAATRDPALRVNGAGSGPVSAEWMILPRR